MKIKKYTNSAWTDIDKPVKKFGNYTDTTTTLPLTIEASATDAIENYQIYGTPDGVGEETENVYDLKLWEQAHPTYCQTVGDTVYITGVDASMISGAINVDVPSGYYFTVTPMAAQNGNTARQGKLRLIDENGTAHIYYITNVNNAPLPQISEQLPFAVKKIGVDYNTMNNGFGVKQMMFTPTAPTSYIPYGYKIPILNTSQSGNLFDKNATDETKGYLNNRILRSDGSIKANSEWIVSEYIPVFPETTYVVSGAYGTASTPSIAFYNSNKEVISAVAYNYEMPKTVVTPPLTAFMRASVVKPRIDTAYIIGYYQSNYDLFIGDSKLTDEEYLDYQEQKVYKRTANLWNGKIEQGGMYGGSDRPPTDSNYYKRCRTIGYIDLEAQTEYTLVSSNYQIYCYAYKDGVYVSNQILEQWSKSHSISTSSSFNQIRFMIGNDDLTQGLLVDDIINDIMLTEGSTAPQSYIPYLQPTDPPLPFPAITTYLGENSIDVDTTVQTEKVLCEYQGWKPAGDGEMKYYHNGWVNTPPPTKPSWLADGYEAVLDAKTAPSNYYCDLAYVENGIQMVYRVYVSTDTTCQIEHPDNYISVFQSPYSSSFRGFTTYGVRYNNGVWDVATTTSNQDRGQTAYASIASQRAILSSTITNLTNASGYTFEDYR